MSFRERDCGRPGLRGATVRGRVAGDSHRWQSTGKVGCAGTCGLAGRTLRYVNRTWVYRKRDLTNLLLIDVDWVEMHSPASSGRYAGQADFLLLVTFDEKNNSLLRG